MKHVGQFLKNYIENHQLKKGDIAKAAGISYNYLSTIFKRESIDAQLLERLFVAAGIHPSVVFDVPESVSKNYSDIWASTLLGNATVSVGEAANLREQLADKERIIAEKERLIQILMATAGISPSGQKRDNNEE